MLLECGTSLLQYNLKPMEYMYICTNDSEPQPTMTFLKNILQLYMSGETIFKPLSVITKSSRRVVILRSSLSRTTTHMDMNIYIHRSVITIPIT